MSSNGVLYNMRRKLQVMAYHATSAEFVEYAVIDEELIWSLCLSIIIMHYILIPKITFRCVIDAYMWHFQFIEMFDIWLCAHSSPHDQIQPLDK